MKQKQLLSRVCAILFVLVLGATATAALPGLVAYWTFDEGQGNTAADSSGNGLDGTLKGGAKWVAGQLGGALSFDGSDDFVEIPNNALLSLTTQITISAWTYMAPNASGEMAIVSKGGWAANDLPYELTETPGDVIFWQFYNDEGRDSCSPMAPPVGQWHHIAATYDGKIFKCYIDGKLGEEWAYAGTMPKNTASVTIGKRSRDAECFFNGMIDDVAIYDRALTLDEILSIMEGHLVENPLANSPKPRNGEMVTQTWATLTWRAGDFAKLHEVYFGDNLEAVTAATPASTGVFVGRQSLTTLTVGMAGGPVPGGLIPATTYYWRVDEVNDANSASPWKGNVWSFQVQPLTASKPFPPDGMRYVDPNQDLSWASGMGAIFHTVYFGRDFDQVSNGTIGLPTATGTYEPGKLDLNRTYYWRIDEFAFPGNVTYKGPVWSFTTRGTGGGAKAQYFNGMELAGSPVLTRIEGTINHNWAGGEVVAGLSDSVSARWTANLEAPFTETFRLITTSDDGARLWLDGRLVINDWEDQSASDSSADAKFIAGQIYSIVMEYYENGGDAVAQLSWESPTLARQIIPQGWLQLPVRAAGPYPGNGATGAPQALGLRWIPGDKAASQEIYFGDNKDLVEGGIAPTARLDAGEATYDPGTLEWGKTYYWRVDEVNAAEAGSPWKGVTWSFTTADFLVVDDFETYTDTVGERVFQTWLDGFGYTEPVQVTGNGTGSTVGNADAPFAELATVYSGYQAMPMDFNNAIDPFYSEAERTWATPQNWTVGGVNALVLYIQGDTLEGVTQLYVVLEDSSGNSAVVSRAPISSSVTNRWIEWKIPLSAFTKVSPTKIKKMYIGVGDRTAPVKGGAGRIYIDDIRVVKP